MGIIPLDKFNLNNFYEKTPKPLKYILVVSVIIMLSYLLFANKVTKSQKVELAEIERSIESTYKLINNFETFQDFQTEYNNGVILYLDNIYTLVGELNENTNKKFDILLRKGGENTGDILEYITILNESFDKIKKAYIPKELEEFKEENEDISLKHKISVSQQKK